MAEGTFLRILQEPLDSPFVDVVFKVRNRRWTNEVDESDMNWNATGNNVAVGRHHENDENGPTRIQYGELKAYNKNTGEEIVGLPFQLVNYKTVESKMSNVYFNEPLAVITGYYHDGDENDPVRFTLKQIKLGDYTLTRFNTHVTRIEDEYHNSYLSCTEDNVWTGFRHSGDERKGTVYYSNGIMIYQVDLREFGLT